MTLYRRNRGDGRTERLAAAAGAAAGLAVGAAVWYFARLWLQREPLEGENRAPPPAVAEGSPGAPPPAAGRAAAGRRTSAGREDAGVP